MFDKNFWKDNGVLIACGLIGLSISAVLLSHQTGQPLLPQISLKELLAPYISGVLAILKGLLLAIVITAAAIIIGLLVIPIRNWLKYQMEQCANELDDSERETVAREIRINGQGYQREKPVAAPREALLDGLQQQRLQNAIDERNEWQRKYMELLAARQSPPEPERELTYRAVAALLKTGNVGIKEAIRVVRENGGVVGRKGYDELRDLLALLPSPIVQKNPDSRNLQAVNRESDTKTVVREPVNRPAMGRSQPRRRRG